MVLSGYGQPEQRKPVTCIEMNYPAAEIREILWFKKELEYVLGKISGKLNTAREVKLSVL